MRPNRGACAMMADVCLKKADPAKKPTRKISLHSSEADVRYIPAQIKKEVWLRDKSKCTYPGCESKHQLELDHIHLDSTPQIFTIRVGVRKDTQ